jgi:CheY-like chemotaxis protein
MTVNVLVVDDEPVMRSLISRMLARLDCTPFEVGSGPDAEAKIDEINPALVFLDIMMPDQDGYTTAKNLRGQGYKGKIVMLTAISPEAGLRRALEAGANDYMQKPVSREGLQNHIEAVRTSIIKGQQPGGPG